MKRYTPEDYIAGFSIDCVVFSFHDQKLHVLLLKLKGMEKWALPGGFLRWDENVDDAAARILEERTGLTDIFLKQFHLFGDLSRDDRRHVKRMADLNIISDEQVKWFDSRFISMGYYALVKHFMIDALHADFSSISCDWYPMEEIPSLMLDHREILDTALKTLQIHINMHPIGLNLLPEEFTMPELQSLYEAILNKSLDRRNFQRKILGLGLLEKTRKRQTGEAHKAPWLYRFLPEEYDRALLEGFSRGF